MLTAASAMGYLCYAVNLILCIKYRRELFGWISRHQKIRVFFIVLGLFLCVGAEISTHVFSNFITSWGSYTSRHDDTLMSFLISRDYPLFGVGIANDTGDVWQSYYGSLGKLELYHNPESLSRSNGFGNCLYTAGIPFTLLYMYMLLKHMKKVNSINSKIDMLLLLAMFLGFFFGEPFMFTPFFLGAFFKWHFNQNQRIRQYSTAGKYTSAG